MGHGCVGGMHILDGGAPDAREGDAQEEGRGPAPGNCNNPCSNWSGTNNVHLVTHSRRDV